MHGESSAIVFVLMGVVGTIPTLHYVLLHSYQHAVQHAALQWLQLMGVCYITGAVIYALRVPERIWPGKFDIWFASHQIFHVFVLLGMLTSYYGITEIAERQETLWKMNALMDSSLQSQEHRIIYDWLDTSSIKNNKNQNDNVWNNFD